MYKVASDRHQVSLHRGRLGDWVNGDEHLSVPERLRQLQEGTRIIDARISSSTGKERRELGQQKQDLQNQIKALKDQHGLNRKTKPQLCDIFVNLAKEMLPRVQFEIIMKAANREYEQKFGDEQQASLTG